MITHVCLAIWALSHLWCGHHLVMSWYFTIIISQYVILYSCQLVMMLLQYSPNDLNGDNPHFREQAHLWLNEADYPESADQSDREARRVLAAEMMLQKIPLFSQPEVHLILFINVFKYMAFFQMQESRGVTVGAKKKLLKRYRWLGTTK